MYLNPSCIFTQKKHSFCCLLVHYQMVGYNALRVGSNIKAGSNTILMATNASRTNCERTCFSDWTIFERASTENYHHNRVIRGVITLHNWIVRCSWVVPKYVEVVKPMFMVYKFFIVFLESIKGRKVKLFYYFAWHETTIKKQPSFSYHNWQPLWWTKQTWRQHSTVYDHDGPKKGQRFARRMGTHFLWPPKLFT